MLSEFIIWLMTNKWLTVPTTSLTPIPREPPKNGLPITQSSCGVGRRQCSRFVSKKAQGSTEADQSRQLIGTVGLAISDFDHQAEIGYWLGRDYWGQGFCTEAVIAVLDYGFETLGLNRIFAQHIARNGASARVLEKAGFSKEGILRQHARKWGVFEDVICYGMLCKDDRPANAGQREAN